MIYFREYARKLGCQVDTMGDLAVWNFIRYHQNRPPLCVYGVGV